VLGLVGALVTGTTAVAQLERSLNRLYGVETDRPTGRKYVLAFLLAVSAGLLGTGAFIAIAFGRSLGETFTNETAANIWAVVRWPLGLLLSMGAIALLFKVCPRRHQPAWSWLAYGATAAVVLWVAVTAALGLFFRVNDSFGKIYGPLAGVLALLLWAFLSALAVLFGAALAAQLEAVRAGAARPQDTQKVVTSEPDTRVLAPSAIAGR
jgi:YihY family inner membrane protein